VPAAVRVHSQLWRPQLEVACSCWWRQAGGPETLVGRWKAWQRLQASVEGIWQLLPGCVSFLAALLPATFVQAKAHAALSA
jgi:hypothetical protein